MTIKDTHDIILFYLDKEQNGYLSHEEIDSTLDRAQMVLFNQYFNNPRIPAAAQPQVYSENQRIHDSLAPFKDKFTFTGGGSPVGITSGGVISLPANFMHLLSLYTTVYSAGLGRNVYSSVQILNEEELIERLESQVIPVSADDPIGIMNKENKIQLFPESAQTGGLYFLRKPAKPNFVYTQSGRVITHNAGTSQDLEWKDSDVNNIIVIALQYLGINLGAQDVIQFAEAKSQQGQ